MVALTLTLNEKHFSEVLSKEKNIRFLLIHLFVLLCACIISCRVEKTYTNVPLDKEHSARFSDGKLSWILIDSRVFFYVDGRHVALFKLLFFVKY